MQAMNPSDIIVTWCWQKHLLIQLLSPAVMCPLISQTTLLLHLHAFAHTRKHKICTKNDRNKKIDEITFSGKDLSQIKHIKAMQKGM